jgi:hypothetical protein
MNDVPAGVSVDRLVRAIEDEVRQERRERMVARGGPDDYRDHRVYAEVERVLRRAAEREDAGTSPLLLPELAADDESLRLQTHLRFASHRRVTGGFLVFAKRRLLLPLTRWLYQYARDNFKRQERINRLLFACVEELAIENAKLRGELGARQAVPPPSSDASQ